jgi:hypothetical protein
MHNIQYKLYINNIIITYVDTAMNGVERQTKSIFNTMYYYYRGASLVDRQTKILHMPCVIS